MPPEYGHLNRHYNLAKYLAKLGHKVTVIVGSKLHNTRTQIIKGKEFSSKYEHSESFDYFFVKTMDYGNSKIKRVFAMFQYIINAKKLIKTMDKQDVYIGSSAHPLASILAINLSRKNNCLSIAEVRDLWPESIIAYKILKKNSILVKIMYFIERWIYSSADRIVFTMEGGKDYIIDRGWNHKKWLKVDMGKIYHINNGVDLEIFRKNAQENIYENNEYSNTECYKIVYVGSIRKANQIDTLLDLAKLVNNHKIIFYIFGDGDFVETMKKRITKENINNVKYMGYVEKRYIPSILSLSDLNIIVGHYNPIYQYGISMNKLFDYFASGKPILTTFKSNYSLIERYKAGIEFETYDLTYMASEIDKLSFNLKNQADMKEGAIRASYDYHFAKLAVAYVQCIHMQ